MIDELTFMKKVLDAGYVLRRRDDLFLSPEVKAKERLAALAAYYMARFDSNLGQETQVAAYDHIASLTMVKANTIKSAMKQNFDGMFENGGWDDPTLRPSWNRYALGEVYDFGQQLDRNQLSALLVMLGFEQSHCR